MDKRKTSAVMSIIWVVGVVVVFALSPADPISFYLLEGAFSLVVLALWGVTMAILSHGTKDKIDPKGKASGRSDGAKREQE